MDLQNILTSAATALVVVVVAMFLVGGNSQPGVGGATRFPNSDLEASSVKATGGDLYVGESGSTGCIVMRDSDDGDVSYVTILNGTLVATNTVSCL